MKLLLTIAALAFTTHLPAAEPALHINRLPVGRVLFLGNSITLHGPSEQIGWLGNWGMAASAADKDYVHLVTAHIAKAGGAQPQTMVENIADFERGYTDFNLAAGLKAELAFKPDLIILAIGENVSALNTDGARAAYAKAFANLLAEVKQHGQPTIFVRGTFWHDETKDQIMREAATKAGATFIDISTLGGDPKNAASAEREFKHAGVAGHPGDQGMQKIADAINSAIDQVAQANSN